MKFFIFQCFLVIFSLISIQSVQSKTDPASNSPSFDNRFRNDYGARESKKVDININDYKNPNSGRKNRIEEDDMNRFDLVPKYTKSISSKLMVSLSSALMSSFMMYFISIMVLSYSSYILMGFVSFISAVYSFLSGDLGDLCRALGVFNILLLQRTKFSKFLTVFISQSKGMLMMGERRLFPPNTENPWQYIPSDEVDLKFNMMNAIIGIVLTGTIVGWKIAKSIPFFPGWIGAIGGAAILGYATTFRDGRGDMLRFIGYILNKIFSGVLIAADDVYLKEKMSVLFGQILYFARQIDKRYNIIVKVQTIVTEIIRQITVIIGKIRNERNNSNNNMKFKDVVEEEVDVKYDNYNINNNDDGHNNNNQKKYPRYGRRRSS